MRIYHKYQQYSTQSIGNLIILFIIILVIGRREGVLSSSACSSSQFTCPSDSTCLPRSFACDGEWDCGGGEDEEGCQDDKGGPGPCSSSSNDSNSTSSSDFTCHNNACIPARWKCDGEPDCPLGEDEAPSLCSNYTCSPDQFTCNDDGVRKCLPLTWVCDANWDCLGGGDEKNCNSTCTGTEFTCGNGKCITGAWVCDGNNDCGDESASDEQNCPILAPTPTTLCHPMKDFTCANGKCILKTWRCDGHADCADGSDEVGCEGNCKSGEIECDGGDVCVPGAWHCDSYPDCMDGSDESNCTVTSCRPDQFSCSGTCIPGHLVCSGEAECLDGSDEKNCSNSIICHGFSCKNGKCIDSIGVCNQINECGDWSDEPKNCHVNECLNLNASSCANCTDLPIGYECSCPKGFEWVKGDLECRDTNECTKVLGICSQKCINEPGGYKCECFGGYLKDPHDHSKCKAVEGHASLLFSGKKDVRKLALDHLKLTPIAPHPAPILDYVFRTGFIYWSDGTTFSRAPIDEGNKKTTVFMATMDGFCIDWVYGRVYWTTMRDGTISVGELEGENRGVLAKGLSGPKGIAVEPKNGHLFFTTLLTPSISRMTMDGKTTLPLVTTSILYPVSLTLDLVLRAVYWADLKMHSISAVNYDGGSRREIVKSNLIHPVSVSTFEEWIYTGGGKSIHKINKFTGNLTQLIETPRPLNVLVYHAYRQPDAPNLCVPLKCSHLCVPDGHGGSGCVCVGGEKNNCKNNYNSSNQTHLNPVIAPKSKTQQHSPDSAPSPNNNNSSTPLHRSSTGYIYVIVSCAVLVIVLALYLIYRTFSKQNTLNFENPVYHKASTNTQNGHTQLNHHSQEQEGKEEFGFFEGISSSSEPLTSSNHPGLSEYV